MEAITASMRERCCSVSIAAMSASAPLVSKSNTIRRGLTLCSPARSTISPRCARSCGTASIAAFASSSDSTRMSQTTWASVSCGTGAETALTTTGKSDSDAAKNTPTLFRKALQTLDPRFIATSRKRNSMTNSFLPQTTSQWLFLVTFVGCRHSSKQASRRLAAVDGAIKPLFASRQPCSHLCARRAANMVATAPSS